MAAESPSIAKQGISKLSKTVAVVGAGGPTGLECVKRLLQEGTPVRAIVRSPEKYAGKLEGADVVAGDVTNETSLQEAFTGCRGVIFAASASSYSGAGGPYEVDYLGVKKAASAAAAVGVQQVVLISSRLVNPINRWHPIRLLLNNIRWSLMDYKYEGEEALRHSGIDYTIIRPGGLTGGEGQRPSKSPPGTDYIHAAGPEADMGIKLSIHRADVAAVACQALKSEDAKGKTVEIGARPREAGDPSFADRLRTLFSDLPADA